MKGEVVGGVRIRPMRPKLKTKISFTSANFEKAAAAKATKEMIEKKVKSSSQKKEERRTEGTKYFIRNGRCYLVDAEASKQSFKNFMVDDESKNEQALKMTLRQAQKYIEEHPQHKCGIEKA